MVALPWSVVEIELERRGQDVAGPVLCGGRIVRGAAHAAGSVAASRALAAGAGAARAAAAGRAAYAGGLVVAAARPSPAPNREKEAQKRFA